jgi:RHS repeat-associated protein
MVYEPTYAGGVLQLFITYIADYFPYGKVLREYVNTGSGAERFLTTQHERDKETGLDYRGARYYDSDISRFLSLDPLAREFPSWSAYNYVVGNPISLIDPTGRSPEGTGDDKKKKQEERKDLNPDIGTDLPEQTITAEQPEYLKDFNQFLRNSQMNFQEKAFAELEQWAMNHPEKVEENMRAYQSVKSIQNYLSGLIKPTQSHAMESADWFWTLFLPMPKIGIGSTAVKGIGNIRVPVYRVYGGGSSMYGKSYSLINPKFVPNYRNFAGLPNVNTGQYLLRGKLPLKDINVGRWFAAPLDGRTGGLPLELYQNFNQLSKPVNIILKKPF